MSCSSSQPVCRLAAGMWSALCHTTLHHTVADHMRPDQEIGRKEVNREKRVGRRVDVDINHSLARECCAAPGFAIRSDWGPSVRKNKSKLLDDLPAMTASHIRAVLAMLDSVLH